MRNETQQAEKALSLFLEQYKITFDIEYVKNLIYNSDKDWYVLNGKKYMEFRIDVFDEYNIDLSQNLLDLVTTCRNNFPHKELNGKCPSEIYSG